MPTLLCPVQAPIHEPAPTLAHTPSIASPIYCHSLTQSLTFLRMSSIVLCTLLYTSIPHILPAPAFAKIRNANYQHSPYVNTFMERNTHAKYYVICSVKSEVGCYRLALLRK